MPALIVVGSAPCWRDDLLKARALYPTAEVMTVNGACTLVEDAEHMLAGHTAKANEFVAARQKAFPGRPIRVHANTLVKNARQYKNAYPGVTDWHGPEMSSGATSAGKAALIGLKLGFYPIILAGCPMDGSGYDPKEAVVKHDKSCQRVGDSRWQQRRMICGYREKLVALAGTTFKDRVFSMSGFTRTHLGAPPSDWLSC